MQTDFYTKAILTVIALALSTIAIQGAIPSAFAQGGAVQKVVICDATATTYCASVDAYALRVTK